MSTPIGVATAGARGARVAQEPQGLSSCAPAGHVRRGQLAGFGATVVRGGVSGTVVGGTVVVVVVLVVDIGGVVVVVVVVVLVVDIGGVVVVLVVVGLAVVVVLVVVGLAVVVVLVVVGLAVVVVGGGVVVVW